ncbi:MAG: Hsp20 family protein [Candidatus Lokiarchaeota archaeon]|nr:Hsp20 family protein [Candidatus Lokiarchaeota archaeon]
MTEVKDKEKVDITETKVKDAESKAKSSELDIRKRTPVAPFRSLDRFFNRLSRVFDNFWTPSRMFDFEPMSLSVFEEEPFFRTPLANIKDLENKFEISAELPGLDKKDLEILVHDGILEIKGEKKVEHEEEDEGYVRREYRTSSYHRTFDLPENIDEDRIDAIFDNGILTLDLPKKEVEEKEKKKIDVK